MRANSTRVVLPRLLPVMFSKTSRRPTTSVRSPTSGLMVRVTQAASQQFGLE